MAPSTQLLDILGILDSTSSSSAIDRAEGSWAIAVCEAIDSNEVG